MKNKIIISTITIITFIVCTQVKYFYAYPVFGVSKWNNIDILTGDILVTVFQFSVIAIVTWLMFKVSPFQTLGLNTGFLNSLKRAFICCLPIFIGYPFLAKFHGSINVNTFYGDLVSAGFLEEYMFRGFLFDILFLYCGWGFIPAALIASLVFGSGHLYQASDFNQAISVFLFTAVASTGFAFVYIIWKSLWLPIFLHAFMDLTWDIFNQNGGALGNSSANIFRFTTIGLAIFFSIRKARAEKFSLKGKLWVNHATPVGLSANLLN